MPCRPVALTRPLPAQKAIGGGVHSAIECRSAPVSPLRDLTLSFKPSTSQILPLSSGSWRSVRHAALQEQVQEPIGQGASVDQAASA